MYPFDPPLSLTVLFTGLAGLVVVADVLLVRRAAPVDRARTWTVRAAVLAVVWLVGHTLIAKSGVIEGTGMPPPVMPYLGATALIGVAVAFSPIGRRLAAVPLVLLIGLQAFRVPLEILLHALYSSGDLPIQMTWSGLNFDVATGITAAGVAWLHHRKPLPDAALWAWNVLGLALLVTVVVIAITSAPGPLRHFTDDPPVVLVFFPPYTWIVSVFVWTALVGHLVIFRALWARRAHVGA